MMMAKNDKYDPINSLPVFLRFLCFVTQGHSQVEIAFDCLHGLALLPVVFAENSQCVSEVPFALIIVLSFELD